MSKKIDDKSGVETTGHSWDGIEEYNNPLPKWWLYIFYITIIWGIGYTIAYPAWPMIKKATPGLLGYSTRADVQADIDAVNAQNAALTDQLATIDLTTLKDNEELYSFAVNGGAAIFRAHCSQCHGDGGAGVQKLGYPNLTDDDWLWGGAVDDGAGTMNEIAFTVRHGIRNDVDPDTRWSQMPAFGKDGILPEEEVAAVVQHVLKISGQEFDTAQADLGAEVYDINCAACHGVDGAGDIYQGAPNLTDFIWLYGGSEEALTESVNNARFGIMPNWGERLTDAEVNAVAAYVHQLGGGL